MKVQRGQHGVATDCFDFNIVNGQNGVGIYTFPDGDKAMQEYYTRNGENLFTIEIPGELVLDLSKNKIDYWTAREIMFHDDIHKAFIFEHSGHDIPTSKEIVITEPYIITNITLCKK